MSIAAIIHEIDEYLVLLRRARIVLTGSFNQTGSTGAAKRTEHVRGRKKAAAKPLNRKLRSSRSHTDPSLEPLRPSPSVPSTSTDQPSDAKPSHRSSAEVMARVVPPGDAILASLPTPPKRRRNTTAARAAISRKLRAPSPKPAIALAGPMNAKIVVVSAAQAQREREEATRPLPQKPRVPATGLSGRRAFEALFGDLNDASKNSRQ
jgi:hypothetical protein